MKLLWKLQVIGVEEATVLFSLALFLDLYLTLSNPFSSRSKRENYYIIAIAAFVLLTIGITVFLLKVRSFRFIDSNLTLDES